MSNDPNDFLMGGGGGAKSATLSNIGDKVGGIVVSRRMMQQTEYGTNKPKFWDNGDPMMQQQVVLQTNLPPEDAEDDGRRAIYLKGGFKRPSSQKAVADAVRAVGATGLEDGGYLEIEVTGFGQATRGNPPKEYRALYQAPVNQFLQEPAPVQPHQQQYVQQAPMHQAPTPQYVQQPAPQQQAPTPQYVQQPAPQQQVNPASIFPPQG